MKKIYCLCLTVVGLSGFAYANGNLANSNQPGGNGLGSLNDSGYNSVSGKLGTYSGVPGTGVPSITISSTGAALEFSGSGTQAYLFYSQTLANGIYYEGRVYGKYNYETLDPQFNGVPTSSQNNPIGYGLAAKFGYDFKPTNLIDIIPYLRVNAYKDMSVAYSDSQGNSIHSITYAILPGVKLAYKVSPVFNPYVEFYGGWQQVNLDANFSSASAKSGYIPGSYSSTMNQITLTYEIGFSSKLSKHLALIPYIQYNTASNATDSNIQYIDNAGFNFNSLTSTSQTYGIKLSASW